MYNMVPDLDYGKEFGKSVSRGLFPVFFMPGRGWDVEMRFAYLDSSLQEVNVVSFGRIVMLIVSVGIVEYVHALSPSPVMVGKLPLVMPPSALALEQWQKADGSAFGLPSKPSP